MSYESKGKCRICEKEFKAQSISRHLGSELSKISSGNYKHYHIKIDGGIFFLHLLMEENSTLLELDDFLKLIWLECCGHMSEFMIPGASNDAMDMFGMDYEAMAKAEKDAKNKKLKTVFSKGFSCRYIYDWGSSTELEIKVMGEYNLPKKQKGVVILSRNEELDHTCHKCGEKAVFIDQELMYEGPDCFLCENCGEDEEMVIEVSNSPRMGVCAYEEGPEQKDYVFKKPLKLV